ncbi:tetratricopeptide repeat protein, partial [Pseudomonas aeruginosa]
VPWLKAASDSEETGHPKVARRAYEEAVRRWPEDAFAWFALGNSRYAAGDSAAAEQAMLTSVERRVDFAAGWFNLSQLLAERGCAAPARQAQASARALQPGEARFAAALPQAVAPVARCAELPACPVGAPPR